MSELRKEMQEVGPCTYQSLRNSFYQMTDGAGGLQRAMDRVRVGPAFADERAKMKAIVSILETMKLGEVL